MSITRFPSNALSTREFRWLPQEAWEDTHKSYFCSHIDQRFPLGITQEVPYNKGLRRPASQQLARYILECPIGSPAATLEINGIARSFTIISLILSEIANKDLSFDQAQTALAFGISGVFLMSRADLATIIPSNFRSERQLKQLNWGTKREIWSPWRQDALLIQPELAPGRLITLWDIDPVIWWESSQGSYARQHLAYLEKQMSPALTSPKPSSKRGLIQFFSRKK